MAEEARLESVCTPKGYQEFESPSLRANRLPVSGGRFFICDDIPFRTYIMKPEIQSPRSYGFYARERHISVDSSPILEAAEKVP